MEHMGAGAMSSRPATAPASPWLSREMRVLLFAAGVLVFLAGVQLFVLSERAEDISPGPATAVFLGAGYWAAVAVEGLAAIETSWERARVAVPAVFVFTTLTLIATLLHIDVFHFDAAEFSTRAVTWAWLAVYAIVPLIMGVLWWRQSSRGHADAGRFAPMSEWAMAVACTG